LGEIQGKTNASINPFESKARNIGITGLSNLKTMKVENDDPNIELSTRENKVVSKLVKKLETSDNLIFEPKPNERSPEA
jgi:hypothetical protein